MSDTLRQSNFICPKCGSWYRRGNVCNKCKTDCGPDKLFFEERPLYGAASAKGKTWDSKPHKYVYGTKSKG